MVRKCPFKGPVVDVSFTTDVYIHDVLCVSFTVCSFPLAAHVINSFPGRLPYL